MLVNLNLEYFGIFVFIVISGILSVVLLLISYLSPYKRGNIEKISAYECGFEPFNSGTGSFDVHFYIVGILFIIFDLELVFLFPWALNFYELGQLGLISVFIFLFILTVGFFYEWQKGAMDWSKGFITNTPNLIKND